MRKTIGLLFAALALVSCGDDDDCDQVCTDGFVLTFGDTGLQPGVWTVNVIVQDELIQCSTRIPRIDEQQPVNCTNPAVTLNRGASDTLGTLFVFGTPEQIEVFVERDGAEIARDTFLPSYEGVRAGEECPVACEQAEASLQLVPGVP